MRYATQDEEVAALVRAAIDAAGRSHDSVRQEAGISDGVWQRTVRHGSESLRVTALLRIAAVLNVEVASLMPEREQVAA